MNYHWLELIQKVSSKEENFKITLKIDGRFLGVQLSLYRAKHRLVLVESTRCDKISPTVTLIGHVFSLHLLVSVFCDVFSDT